jgi:hypothetical protein
LSSETFAGPEVQPIGSVKALNSARSWLSVSGEPELLLAGIAEDSVGPGVGVGDGCRDCAVLELLGVCSANFSALANHRFE